MQPGAGRTDILPDGSKDNPGDRRSAKDRETLPLVCKEREAQGSGRSSPLPHRQPTERPGSWEPRNACTACTRVSYQRAKQKTAAVWAKRCPRPRREAKVATATAQNMTCCGNRVTQTEPLSFRGGRPGAGPVRHETCQERAMWGKCHSDKAAGSQGRPAASKPPGSREGQGGVLRQGLEGARPAGTRILDFQPPKPGANHFCCLKPACARCSPKPQETSLAGEGGDVCV